MIVDNLRVFQMTYDHNETYDKTMNEERSVFIIAKDLSSAFEAFKVDWARTGYGIPKEAKDLGPVHAMQIGFVTQ